MKSPFNLPRPLAYKLLAQIAGLAGLSMALGLVFNASNPIGVRFAANPAPVAKPMAAAAKPGLASAASAARAAVPAADAVTASIPLPDLTAVANLSAIEWAMVKPLAAASKLIVVDVRGRPTYDAGHIPGALSLPEWSTPAEVSAFQQQVSTNRPLVVYCGNLSCPASEEMARKLVEQFGYAKVLVMKGGFAEWQKAELGYDATPTRTTWAETKPLIQAGQVLLIDARPKAVYDAGHIPGAFSLPESGPEEGFKEFQRQHSPDQPIVVYCSDLKCSASMRLAIKLATWYNFRKVQFMPGGFQEWQQMELAQAQANPQS